MRSATSNVREAGRNAEPEDYAGDERADEEKGEIPGGPVDHQGGKLGSEPRQENRPRDDPEREAGDGDVDELAAAVVEGLQKLPRGQANPEGKAHQDGRRHRDHHRGLERIAVPEQVDEHPESAEERQEAGMHQRFPNRPAPLVAGRRRLGRREVLGPAGSQPDGKAEVRK